MNKITPPRKPQDQYSDAEDAERRRRNERLPEPKKKQAEDPGIYGPDGKPVKEKGRNLDVEV